MGSLWGLWGYLGQAQRVLDASGAHFEESESAIRRLGDVLEALWGILRGSWGVPGRPWRLPGIILEAFLKDFLAS